MSQDRTREKGTTLPRVEEQELLVQVLRPVIRHLEGGIIGSLEDVNSSEAEVVLSSFKKNSKDEMDSLLQRTLQLKFKNKLILPVWTGIRIKGENFTPIEVVLVDGLTGEVVKSGPEASAKVEIVILQGDVDGVIDWTSEDFNRNIIGAREGNKSLLNGNVYVILKDGVGCVGEIYFAHGSSWMRNSRIRMGARVVDNCEGIRVREAMTDSFTIRDRRMKLYEKHPVPSLSDEIWRLKNINRRGAFCKRLWEGNIKTVQEFLTAHFINPQMLQDILGIAISGKMLKETVAHALKCELDDRYVYYSSYSHKKTGVIFNVVGQLLGVLIESQYLPAEKLSEKDKVDAQELVVSAFKHREEVFPLNKNFPNCDCSELSHVFGSSISHGIESFGGRNTGDPNMFDNDENGTSCIFCQGVTSSSSASDWNLNIADDFGISDTDLMHDPSLSF